MTKTLVVVGRISAESTNAQALKQRLQRDLLGLLDILVSSDQTTIRAGEKWLDEVEEVHKAADILICSPAPSRRAPPGQLRGQCRLLGIPVIPMCHSDMT